MSYKIDSYVNALFADVPRTRRAQELREELTVNLRERYDDYLREGRSESEAYSLSVANMGDVDEMIAEVMPDENFKAQAQHYRNRRARNLAISIALYIIGAALVVLSSVFEQDNLTIYGVVGLLVLAAVATGLIVYTHLSTPVEYREVDEDERRERELMRTPQGRTLKAFRSIYWPCITAVYLSVSFLTFAWHITWIIWPLAAILSGIIGTIIELRAER